MAYQALYRKYRPGSFSEVVGQRQIIQTLKNAVIKDRIAHAYLFCGPRGTGKTSIAKIFAKMLNCTENQLEPCGHCDNCRMVQEGMHPDIIEIDAASNNGVDEVRNLIDKVKYAPMHGKYKVYIIDEVHMMTAGAFNALLKTIEEPPAHVVFILATTEPHKVIPTIISRCQRFDFSSVSEKDIQKRLHDVAAMESLQVDEDALSLIASLAQGGMRDSLSILDQCIAYSPDHVTAKDVREIYGVVTREDIGKLFRYTANENVDDLIQDLEEIAASGMDLKRLTADFISLTKNSILLDHAPETRLIEESEKKILLDYFMSAPSDFRIRLLDELMSVYNKYTYASSILDYLESSLLKAMFGSHEKESTAVRLDSPVRNVNQKSSNISAVQKKSYEIPSDRSEKTEKGPNFPKNNDVFPASEISDVSRETFSRSEKTPENLILEDEFILSLFTGANKKLKTQDGENLKNLNSYLTDLKFGKFSNVLREAQLLVAGENYIVIHVPDQILVKQINEMQNQIGFEDFTEEILNKRKKVFAVTEDDSKRLMKLYKKRFRDKTLPTPAVIQVREKSVQETMTEEEKLRELFPALEVIND